MTSTVDEDTSSQFAAPIGQGAQFGSPVKSKSNAKQGKRKKAGTAKWLSMLHLFYRFLVFAAAWRCIVVSFASVSATLALLRGSNIPSMDGGAIYYPMVMGYAGSGSLRDSPLVTMALGNTTQPRDDTIYLSATGFSTESCVLFGAQAIIMGNTFLRSVYTEIVDDTSYSLHQLTEMELIAPIVDCTYVNTGDSGAAGARLYYLTRGKANPDRVLMLVITLSNQQYSIPAQAETGPAGVATLQIFSDMRETNLTTSFLVSIGYPMEPMSFRVYNYLNQSDDGQWILRNIPASSDELPKVLYTSLREGLFLKAQSQQSNINNMVSRLPNTPTEAVAVWQFITTPVLRDTWAWVHLVHLFIGVRVLMSLLILCLSVYRNLRAGKLWIGDAFVALSSTQSLTAAVVLFSMYMNEFWTLQEFCYNSAYTSLGLPSRATYDNIMRADLLTLFLGACGIIGSLFRERIDPLLVMICFEIGYGARMQIINGIPKVLLQVQIAGFFIFIQNVVPRLEGQELISPMLTQGEHAMDTKNVPLIFACLVPIFLMLVVIIGYVILRKIYRHFYPEELHIQRNTTGTARSENEDAFLAQKRVLTLFEIATGAELENRFGLVCDYETCIFIKGMKFASADGIYSNGFVIANKKYLVSADDVWTIIAMKILRKRFTNVWRSEYFLVREKANYDLVSILIITLSNQQYSIPAQAEAGPAGVATLQIFSDMRETNLTTYFLVSIGYPMEPMSLRTYTYLDQSKDGQWILRNIPASSGELPKVLHTSLREGVYLRDPSQQSNINNMLWRLPTKPVEAISEWHFICTPVLRDTCAWVHLNHVFIGARVLLNQLVLCVATYRNFRAGKLWIGDAFVALSSSQLVNAVAVLISWYVDEFWSLYEYCYNAGYTLLDLPPRMTYEDIMRADLLTLFLGAGGIIGSISRERIRPFLVVVCFHISYGVRMKIMGKIPILRTEVQKAGRNIYLQNVFPRLEGQDAVSPMLTRGEHPFEEKHVGFVVACLVPTFFTLMVIINYVIIRKIRRRLHPEKVRVQRNTTGTARSESEESLVTRKRVFTLFELATGAELENRFSLACDYETCIFIKGMKFASVDGIYSNGFVIANKKYLVSANDFWTILAMKMLRKRFTNVYVYEVNGSTVQPTARLVYPHTLTLTDMVNLNVSILS
ncbi:hypothetical protein Poli38472_003915 [Pythium oligandrum]|uniref:Uncharacterized protein n=1 Tax=Pythium oligandrum TaxID=41045 RepID=A0A8K1FJJ9_PYTOL|nr:hypothetical protein Poli38472_003915 [Pythium oligandrum]|eukprot:TMW66150.1 hypothetical protein Poli38472_003915 [Pythium oligandrum]